MLLLLGSWFFTPQEMAVLTACELDVSFLVLNQPLSSTRNSIHCVRRQQHSRCEALSVTLWRERVSWTWLPILMANGDAWFTMLRTCVSQSVFTKRRVFFSHAWVHCQSQLRHYKWRWRTWCLGPGEYSNQGQVASSVGTEGLNTSGTHMVRAAYSIGIDFV